MRNGILAAAAAFLVVAAGPVAAQETGDVMGRVTVEGTSSPIGTALVLIEGTGARATTDDQGRYHLHRIPAGTWTIRIQSLGHTTLEQSIEIVAGETVQFSRAMTVLPIRLGGIQVNVLRPDLRPEGRLQQDAIQAANPRDPGEVLRQLPGVSAVRRGPLGLDPVVRGLRETEIGSYIDGERRFPAGPARMDSPLTHVDPLAFSSIEVVKGPYALTWGAGNLAAIRVETQTMPVGYVGVHGNLTAGYNSNLDAAETSASLLGRSGGLSWWAFGAFRNGNDYEDGNGDSVPGDFESWEARGKVSIETGDESRLTIGGGYQDQGGPIDYPGRLLNAQLFQTANASVEWNKDLSSNGGTLQFLDIQAYYSDTDHDMTNEGKPTADSDPLRTPPFPLDVQVLTSTEMFGGRAAGNLAIGDWGLEVGADGYTANRNAGRTVRRADMDPEPLLFDDLVWPDVTISDIGVFARGDRRLSDHVHLSLAGRVDFVAARADTASQFFLDNVSTNLDSDETNLSVAATLSLGLSSNWTLNLAVGSAARTADALERYSDRFPASKAQIAAEFVGNPDLEPERSTKGDIWLEGSFENVSVQASVFARSVDNYITLTPTTLPKRLPLSPDVVFQYVNGDAFFWGFDAQAAIGLSADWTLKLAADYLWAEDRLLDEPAIGISPTRGTLGVRYELPSRDFHAEATMNVLAEMGMNRVALTRGETPTDSYVTGDLRFGWQATERVLVRFGVENIADEFYVDHLNAKDPFTGRQVPEAGRVFYGKVSLAF